MFAIVYGSKMCNFCTLVVNALEKEGATVEKKDVSEPNILLEMKKVAGELLVIIVLLLWIAIVLTVN